MAAEIEFGLLGPLTVRRHAVGVTVPRGKQRVVLATLLLNAGRVVGVDELAETLWLSGAPRSGPVAVANYVMRLRNTLGDIGRARIITQPPGYLIRVEAGELDLAGFEALLGAARAAARDGWWEQAATQAGEALELWRGEPLTGVDSEALTAREAPRLAELRVQAVELRIDADLHLGRHAQVIAELRQLAAVHPLRERVHGQLMLALYRDGRQGEALAAYARARDVLIAELGVEPGPGLQDLHQQILTADPALRVSTSARSVNDSLGEAGPEPVPVAIPHQLPSSVPSFVGRRAELEAISGLARQITGTAVVISAVDGMAGVGKTALAICAAHRLAETFPDGQLFVDLHGFTRGREPRTPAEALGGFLRALGVSPQQIPEDTDERAALFRQRLAGTRTLILVDNAVSEAQVRPLLPGGAGCLVLVTSRRRLKGLDDAHVLSLDVLPRADAIALLRAIAGPERAAADDPVLEEIVGLCGQLPLALRIAAALLRHRPAWTVEYLAGRLRDQRQRIGALSDGERDLGAVFELSYRSLPEAQQQLFRLLGLIPGPDLDGYAAAALAGAGPGAAVRVLEDLTDHNLLLQHAPGRYRLHDLIRLYARALADQVPGPDRDAALDRLLDYYQHTAGRADRLIAPSPRAAPDGPAPAAAPALADPDAARAWLRAERHNLLAALEHVTAHSRRERQVALTACLATLLVVDGPWLQAVDLHAAAADAAGLLGDQPGRAYALTKLGEVRRMSGDFRAAAGDLEQALRIYRDLGQRDGQARALTALGHARRLTGDLRAAAGDLEQALRIYRDLGQRDGQAHALTALGDVRRMSGDLRAAAGDLEQALRIYRDLGQRSGQAHALAVLGEVRGMTGDVPGAVRAVEQAIDLYQNLGAEGDQACALTVSGRMCLLAGDLAGAARRLEAAIEIFRRIGASGNQAWALNGYGLVITRMDDYPRARAIFRQALHLARQTHQPDEEALALEGIGECHLLTGEPDAGALHLKQALEIFQHLGMKPDYDRVRGRLTKLTPP